MSETIGNQLAAARMERGLEVEDVAHKTRIHPDVVRHLENDDYNKLPNLMFVRGFLKIYSDFIGVDASLAQSQLSAADTHHGDQYLLGGVSPNVRERFGSLTSRIPVRPILATAAAALLLTIGGGYLVSHLYGSSTTSQNVVDQQPDASTDIDPTPPAAEEEQTEPVSTPAPTVPKTLATAPIDTTIPEKEVIDPEPVPKAAPVVRKAERVDEDVEVTPDEEEVYEPFEVTPGIVGADE